MKSHNLVYCSLLAVILAFGANAIAEEPQSHALGVPAKISTSTVSASDRLPVAQQFTVTGSRQRATYMSSTNKSNRTLFLDEDLSAFTKGSGGFTPATAPLSPAIMAQIDQLTNAHYMRDGTPKDSAPAASPRSSHNKSLPWSQDTLLA
ncbi:MAG: hypothetical protein ACI9UQ_000569, partial [Candidatus Krumholzibacteriia bacterium]